MKHDPLCGWSTRPGEWDALASASPEPPTECSTCADIARIRDAVLTDARDAVAALHVKFTDPSGVDKCNYCWLDEYGDEALIWPCPTLAAIDALRDESVRPTA